MEYLAKKMVSSPASDNAQSELKFAYQFYKNSIKFITLLKKANTSNDVNIINSLKVDTVNVFNAMEVSSESQYKYRKFADTWLEKQRDLYAGNNSILESDTTLFA